MSTGYVERSIEARGRAGGPRGIGSVGTAARVAVGVGLVYIVGAADGLPWDVGWSDVVLGLVALPAITVIAGLGLRRYGVGSIRFTGPVGHAVNCAVIVALAANPYTGGGAGLFYAATLFVAAWRGQTGCEGTVISNLILRRDDQVGCPLFAPLDAIEAKHRTSRAERPAAAHD
jgi:hypothetical protein